jgi:hypothetical protein
MFICNQNKLVNQGIALQTLKIILAQETRSLAAPKPTGSTDRPGPVNSDIISAKTACYAENL